MSDKDNTTSEVGKQVFNKRQLVAQAQGLANKTHGLSGEPEYFIWHHMIDRCYNPSNPRYERYGGRGIQVCERWINSVENFYLDMGPRPAGYTLERVNNDGNYEPDNCQWDTYRKQSRNYSRNRFLTFNGKTQCVADWSEETGLSRVTIRKRLLLGWSIEDALTLPAGQKKGDRSRRP